VAETLVHRNRLNRQHNQRDCHKENASCELLSSSSSSGTEEEEEDIELSRDLIKYCGWWDGHADVSPHPTVCQIGSNDPDEAAFATRVVQKCGYDGIDLNCECPSDRVAGRCFGAALMKDQDAAVGVVSSMVRIAQSISNEKLPVSVKTRIGVDDNEGFEFISSFVQRLVDAGCNQFVIHARKVYTQGLSPAQNRDIPPIDYPCVYRLMEAFPHCSFLINGGIMSLEHARELAFGSAIKFEEKYGSIEKESCVSNDAYGDHAVPCQRCNLPQGSCLGPPRIAPPNLCGVMVGRLARDRPADLADVDRYFYGETSNPCNSRRELMQKYILFLERVYPRRCCDDDETITLEMVTEMQTPFIPKRQCCSICQEFRDQNSKGIASPIEVGTIAPSENSLGIDPSTVTSAKRQQRQSGKRSKRHEKYDGAKIVTRIVDRALQPTWGILAGEAGQKMFRRVSHQLSREKTVRNCGPAYILWKAMQSVSDDVWDKPFGSCSGKITTYYPTK